jgi:hypothetical protein
MASNQEKLLLQLFILHSQLHQTEKTTKKLVTGRTAYLNQQTKKKKSL